MGDLDFDVNCVCDCPGDAPNGGQKLITFRNVSAADLLVIHAAVKAGQITMIECPDCGCHQRLDDDGALIVTVSIATPQITGIGPNQGSRLGGYDVMIYGHAFTEPGLVVKFGGVPATNLRNLADDSVRVTAPAATNAGAVDVTVENSRGVYPVKGTLVGGFTYLPHEG